MNRFKTDFHNHSVFSKCAREEMTVASMVEKFEEFGLEQAGISDHLYLDDKIHERFRTVKREIAANRRNVDIFVGAEVDMLYPGRLIAGNDILQIYDYILVACTHYQAMDRVVPPLYFDYRTIAQNMYDYMMSASSLEIADSIAHPFDARSLKKYREDFNLVEAMEQISNNDFKRIIKNLKEYEVALELTTSLLEEEYAAALFRFLSLAREGGVKFSLGSDAHWHSCMYEIPRLKDYFDRLHIEESDIWTL